MSATAAAAFSRLDADGDGRLSRVEILRMLSEMGVEVVLAGGTA